MPRLLYTLSTYTLSVFHWSLCSTGSGPSLVVTGAVDRSNKQALLSDSPKVGIWEANKVQLAPASHASSRIPFLRLLRTAPNLTSCRVQGSGGGA